MDEKLTPRLQGVDDKVVALEAELQDRLDLLFGLIGKPNPRELSLGHHKGTSGKGGLEQRTQLPKEQRSSKEKGVRMEPPSFSREIVRLPPTQEVPEEVSLV